MSNPRVLIYKTSNGRVSSKVNLGKDNGIISFNYDIGCGKYIKRNKGKDKDKYPLIINMNYLERFLILNNIYNSIEIDSDSIDTFYGYAVNNDKIVYFSNLTPKKVDEWWNLDCPDLYRFSTNKKRENNWFGLNLIYFNNLLIERGFNDFYIQNNITEEEVELLTKGRENARVSIELWRAINARNLSQGEIEYLTEQVKKYEEKIQAVIDKHCDEILAHIEGMVDGAYGLDCGFLRIYTKNEQYNEQKGLLRHARSDIFAPWLNITMPYEPQSLTIKEKEFQKIKEIVERELGETLYSRSILD